MARRLPPLNALRAFEAAARHLSIAKAADELSVTPAAVSHQVRALEARLGAPLFRRRHRSLLLTDAGQRLLPGLRDGFDALAGAVAKVHEAEADTTLTVTTVIAFAARWLVPRLERFRLAHPEFEVRIDASDRTVDLEGGEADVAIRYGRGHYPGLQVARLFADEAFPVCSPALCACETPLATPAELRHHTLLHVDWQRDKDVAPNWRMWLLAAGVEDVDSTRGPRFSDESMAAQAAVGGFGVALVSHVLVADDLAAGRLVRPFALSLPGQFAYYLVCPNPRCALPKVQAFRSWIMAEAAARPGPQVA